MSLENTGERCLVQLSAERICGAAAAEKLRKKECIFTHYRDTVVSERVDLPDGSRSEKETAKRKIVLLFPDTVWGEKA